MADGGGTGGPARRGGRRKGSGRRADPSAPWELRAVQALADGSRWSIVRYVCDGEATVGAIARGLALSVACTSKHLSILQQAGLVEIRRSGRQAWCRLAGGDLEAAALLRSLGFGGPSTPHPSSRPSRGAAPELEPAGSKSRYVSNDLDDYLL